MCAREALFIITKDTGEQFFRFRCFLVHLQSHWTLFLCLSPSVPLMHPLIPEVSGGFADYLIDPITRGERPTKMAKHTGKLRKAYSSIGRLGGVLTIPVYVSTSHIYNIIANKKRSFFLAENLLDAESTMSRNLPTVHPSPRVQ